MPRPNHGVIGHAFLATRGLQILCLLVCMSLAAKFISSMVDAEQAPPQPLVGILCVVCFAILYCAITILLYWDAQLPLLAAAGVDFLFFLALMISSIIIGKPLSYLSCTALTKPVSTKDFVENVGSKLNQYPSTTPTSTFLTRTAAAATQTATQVAAQATPPPPTTNTPTPTFAVAAVDYTTTTIANAAATVSATLTPGGQQEVRGSDGNMYTITGRALLKIRDISVKTVNYNNWITGGTKSECAMMKAVWGFGIALTIMFVFSAIMCVFIWKANRAPVVKKAEADA